MPKGVITLRIVDVDKWLQGKSERADSIVGMGGANVVDHVAHDGSNNIAVTLEADDLTALEAALASPPAELVAAMERHGVIPPLTVYVER